MKENTTFVQTHKLFAISSGDPQFCTLLQHMKTLPINVWLFGVNLPKSSTPTVVPFFPKNYCLLIKKK